MELRGAMAALYRCRDREVLVEGRAGTAKTTGILWKIIQLCRQYPGSRHLLCRATRTRLTESTMVTLERLIGTLHPEVLRVKRIQRHSYRLFGSEIVCGGLDDPQRLYSTEWDTVYVNEATEVSEDEWELFGRAMRHNRMPYQQRLADCNPSYPGHWLNKRAFACSDRLRRIETAADYNRLQAYNFGPQAAARMRRLVAVHQDNPAYFDLKSWRWTPVGTEYVAEVLGRMTGYRRAQMFEGLWRSGEGTVYPEFEAAHVVRDFDPPDDWPIYCGLDPGFDHPCAWLWVTVAPNGWLYVVDEICAAGIDLPQLVERVKERNRQRGWLVRDCLGDPNYIEQRRQESPSVQSQMRKLGMPIRCWPRGRIDPMVTAVRTRLVLRTLKVLSRCKHTIEAFQGWRYKRTGKGDVPAADVDKYEQQYKDPMDVVRGLVAARLEGLQGRVQVVGGE